MKSFKTIALAGLCSLAISLSACTDKAGAPFAGLYPEIAQDQTVLIVADTGGCDWNGQCLSYAFKRSGRVEGSHIDPATSKPVITNISIVSPEKIEAWLARVETTNFKKLYKSFEKGSCNGCVDGIDNFITILPGHGDFAADTVTYTLRGKNPFGEALVLLYDLQHSEH